MASFAPKCWHVSPGLPSGVYLPGWACLTSFPLLPNLHPLPSSILVIQSRSVCHVLCKWDFVNPMGGSFIDDGAVRDLVTSLVVTTS